MSLICSAIKRLKNKLILVTIISAFAAMGKGAFLLFALGCRIRIRLYEEGKYYQYRQ